MPRERVVRRTVKDAPHSVAQYPCPRCGSTIRAGEVATVYDRYGAGRSWHGSCFDEAQRLAATNAAAPSVPRTAGGREWDIDEYQAARERLLRLGSAVSERLMEHAYADGGDDLTTQQAVMFAAEIARRG